jgi:CHAT domain-containing protein/Tfp pilus assembly protein PilF
MLQAAPERDSEAAQARSAFQRGAFDEAAAHWERAVEADRHAARKSGQASDMIELASCYQALGQQSHAVEILDDAVEIAEKSGEREDLIRGKSKLGVALGITRQSPRAEELLRESLEMARKDGLSGLTAAILNDLGNLLTTQGKFEDALAAFAESSTIARDRGDNTLLTHALCNSAMAAALGGNDEKAEELNGQALQAISQLEQSHEKASLLLTAAETDAQIKTAEGSPQSTRLLVRAHNSAEQALLGAETLNDRAIASYALGTLGRLYARDKQLDPALSLTRRAVFATQQAQSPDLLYRWEWQGGRLLKAQGKTNEAIASYRRAVQTLQPIRHDVALGYGNAAAQLSFRESLGPLFFELADLLLAQSVQDAPNEQSLLREARETVEQLKAVELEDYFRDECVNVLRDRSESLEKADAHSAVMYLIPLPTRTEVLISLASGMRRFTAKPGAEELIATVRAFRRNLETRTTYAYLEQAQQVYDWIIRPIHDFLIESKIDTLVFVPDGALQTIPLAALHDGKRFLIEEFAVTITPGLSLVDARPIEKKHAQVLLTGLSNAVQGFPALDFVPAELQEIKTEYPSEVLLNDSFVTTALERKLTREQFTIVHIASHGQFDRDARKTFVLTYDGKLTLNNLEALIRPSQYRGKPVELLVLSACQTAAGDDRAALGLAGVAIKAGARSAVASLWFVNDQSTATFTSELYAQLRQSAEVSRAKAVQAAQLKMLHDRRFRHPCYWAPYLLIGNWL